jgi:hypothetical protein
MYEMQTEKWRFVVGNCGSILVGIISPQIHWMEQLVCINE